MPSITIIYASTSGHTEYVVETLAKALSADVKLIRCESATPEDLTSADVLILASGTWNTGGIEGQLNPHMHTFLLKDCKGVDLSGKEVGIIALGDDRYYYTSRAGEHLRNFIQSHGGKVLGNALVVVNEPYGQEEKMKKWAAELQKHIT